MHVCYVLSPAVGRTSPVQHHVSGRTRALHKIVDGGCSSTVVDPFLHLWTPFTTSTAVMSEIKPHSMKPMDQPDTVEAPVSSNEVVEESYDEERSPATFDDGTMPETRQGEGSSLQQATNEKKIVVRGGSASDSVPIELTRLIEAEAEGCKLPFSELSSPRFFDSMYSLSSA